VETQTVTMRVANKAPYGAKPRVFVREAGSVPSSVDDANKISLCVILVVEESVR
jgi:hypothetical protein